MIKKCNSCNELKEHKTHKAYTCDSCLELDRKWCVGCNEVKSVSEYYKNGKSIRSKCKDCDNKRKRTYSPKQQKVRNQQSSASKRKRYKSDQEYRDKEKQRSRLREANKIEAGYHSLYDWFDCLEYFNNRCAYCGIKTGLTKDHIIPLVKEGSNAIHNIAPSCISCNCSKQDFEMLTWYTSQSFYTANRLTSLINWMKGDDALA